LVQVISQAAGSRRTDGGRPTADRQRVVARWPEHGTHRGAL